MKSPIDGGDAKGPSVLERQMQIVEQVATSQSGLSFTEIQKLIGLPKGTTHRLVQGLCRAAMLEMSALGGRRFQLGRRVKRLLALSVSTHHIVETARPVLRELVAEFQETAFLSGLRNGHVEAVAMVTPMEEWRGHVRPGRVMPAHAAASAKAIFAFQDEDGLKSALPAPLPRFTPHTLVTLPAVMAEYGRVRASGIAICREEIDPGQMAIAAPVSLHNVGVVFSVCIAGPVDRLELLGTKRVSEALQASASRLEALLVRMIEHLD